MRSRPAIDATLRCNRCDAAPLRPQSHSETEKTPPCNRYDTCPVTPTSSCCPLKTCCDVPTDDFVGRGFARLISLAGSTHTLYPLLQGLLLRCLLFDFSFLLRECFLQFPSPHRACEMPLPALPSRAAASAGVLFLCYRPDLIDITVSDPS